MAKRKVNMDEMDKFFLESGFHKHKQSHRGKGLYFSVGGYDITKDDAINIYRNHLKRSMAGLLYELHAISNMNKVLNLDLREQLDEQIEGFTKQIEELL